jgi:Tfp pilus assembly protein PilF
VAAAAAPYCLLALAILAVFLPVAGHRFIGYDDPTYLSRNPRVAEGLTWHGVGWALTAFHAANWHPLTWLSHMLDVSLFGLRPGPHHLVNLLVHLTTSLLLLGVLRALTGAGRVCLLTVLIFAVHPLRAESVAWVAERKDVLAGLFFALTLGAWIRYVRRPSPWRYAAAALLFALGLMAKPMLVTLPLVLLVADLWPLGRGGGRRAGPGSLLHLAAEKAPLVALAGLGSVLTWLAQKGGGMVKPLFVYGTGERLLNAAASLLWYLWKTLLPAGLAMPYSFQVGSHLLRAGSAGAGFLLLASFLAWRWRWRRPWLAAGWLWYLVMLLPVIGLVQVADQSRADRYTYLPLVGPVLALAWEWVEAAAARRRTGLSAAAALAVAALALAGHLQTGRWRDDRTLMTHALRVTRDNWLVHNAYGVVLAEGGDTAGAESHYREAIRIHPSFAFARFNLANLLVKGGRTDEAERLYREALELNPSFDDAWNNLGLLQMSRGDDREASKFFGRALEVNPAYFEALTNQGWALLRLGRIPEALDFFDRAVRVRPEDPLAHRNLSRALLRAGRTEEAAAAMRRAAARGDLPDLR